jgi:fumarate reductase subunit D
MIAMVGLTSMIFMTVNNTVITSIIPDEVRGRVSSVLMMTFGLMPLGVVPATLAAESLGTPVVTAIGAVLLMVTVAAAYLLFPQFRRLDGAVASHRAAHPERALDSRPFAASPSR